MRFQITRCFALLSVFATPEGSLPSVSTPFSRRLQADWDGKGVLACFCPEAGERIQGLPGPQVQPERKESSFQGKRTGASKGVASGKQGPIQRASSVCGGSRGHEGRSPRASGKSFPIRKDWLVTGLEGPWGEVGVLFCGKRKKLMGFEQEQLPHEPKTGPGP